MYGCSVRYWMKYAHLTFASVLCPVLKELWDCPNGEYPWYWTIIWCTQAIAMVYGYSWSCLFVRTQYCLWISRRVHGREMNNQTQMFSHISQAGIILNTQDASHLWEFACVNIRCLWLDHLWPHNWKAGPLPISWAQDELNFYKTPYQEHWPSHHELLKVKAIVTLVRPIGSSSRGCLL